MKYGLRKFINTELFDEKWKKSKTSLTFLPPEFFTDDANIR